MRSGRSRTIVVRAHDEVEAVVKAYQRGVNPDRVRNMSLPVFFAIGLMAYAAAFAAMTQL